MYGTRFRYRASRLGDRFHRWLTRREPGGSGRRLPRSIDGAGRLRLEADRRLRPVRPAQRLHLPEPGDRRARGAPPSGPRREVIEACRDARDPETGAPLFADVFAVAERYGLDPAAEGLPDVLALSADGYQAQAKWGAASATSCSGPTRTCPATHWLDGIVAIDAPDIRPGDHLRADLHDIAPTALAMLGLRVPESMEGRVLHEAFENPLPVRYGSRRSSRPTPASTTLLAAGFGSSEG